MHAYVRGRITGASETLTKTKVRKVINAITTEDREWWRDQKNKERFLEKLAEIYPGCCDGGPRSREKPLSPRLPQQRFSLFDHTTLQSLFSHYAEYCEPWELVFSDGGTVASPHDWLQILDDSVLNAPICEYHASGVESSYTVEVNRLCRSERLSFAEAWHSDRRGWADSGPGSKAVHCFVPRAWIENPPSTAEGMLISLCKKNWISNNSPFYPASAERQICQTCIKLYEKWNQQEPLANGS